MESASRRGSWWTMTGTSVREGRAVIFLFCRCAGLRNPHYKVACPAMTRTLGRALRRISTAEMAAAHCSRAVGSARSSPLAAGVSCLEVTWRSQVLLEARGTRRGGAGVVEGSGFGRPAPVAPVAQPTSSGARTRAFENRPEDLRPGCGLGPSFGPARIGLFFQAFPHAGRTADAVRRTVGKRRELRRELARPLPRPSCF